MNVIGSEPNGWWRDRPAARRRLVETLAGMVTGTCLVTVVFDGTPTGDEVDAARTLGIDARFSPGGPNAADDTIAEMVRADPEPATLTVVTSDRGLVSRLSGRGVRVMGSKQFGSLRSAGPGPRDAR
jgi:predicted RNA-binding protein with PIN domain